MAGISKTRAGKCWGCPSKKEFKVKTRSKYQYTYSHVITTRVTHGPVDDAFLQGDVRGLAQRDDLFWMDSQSIVLKATANYQKRAGTVILSRDAFQWEPSGSADSTAAVAIPVTQIVVRCLDSANGTWRLTRVSMRVQGQQCGKSTDEPKIKLLHRDNKSSFVFEFTGGSTALADRNALRDALESLMRSIPPVSTTRCRSAQRSDHRVATGCPEARAGDCRAADPAALAQRRPEDAVRPTVPCRISGTPSRM